MTTPQGLTLDISADLIAAINGNTAAVRDAERRRLQLAGEVAYIETPSFSFGALPFVAPGWGPNSGFNWAIQSMVLSGFGATTDFVNVYRGNSAAAAVGNNARFTFQQAVAGGAAPWNPGRTGFILKGDESIVFSGTFTGTTMFASIDVIQVTDAQLPYFLL
jgi:hypothetical protein